jgi:SAM-dependent methyltransferase
MLDQSNYVGRDLEVMAFAENYHRWILHVFKPFLGERIVEVGAGTGSFSELVLEHNITSLSLVEPSTRMHQILSERINQTDAGMQIKTYNAVFAKVADQIKIKQRPDSIIYVNVMEHIADDMAELRAVYETLEKDGRLFIFVPALQWLFGSFDKRIGHYRRYSRSELENKCIGAGFKILKSVYFDFAGIVPWGIKYRLLKSNTLEVRSVKFYDRFVVPAARTIESIIEPPIGKSVLLIAEKT